MARVGIGGGLTMDRMFEEKPKKKIDRRILKTKKALFEAFDRLVVNKDYDRITISELAREADIDRKTFYLHYSSIDEMVDDKMNAIVAAILDDVEADMRARAQEGTQDDGDAIPGLRVFFLGVSRAVKEAFPRQAHTFGAMPAGMLAERVVKPLASEVHRRRLLTFDVPLEVRDLYASSIVGAMIGVYASWMKGGMAQSVEEVSDAASRIVGACLREIASIPARP